MKKKYYKGYISVSNDIRIYATRKDFLRKSSFGYISLFESFEYIMRSDYFNDSYIPAEGEEDFWGYKIREPKVLIQIYYTSKPCSFEESQMSLDAALYGGEAEIDIANQGYSDWTITGYDVEKAMIGNHDLFTEIAAHNGQYANIYVKVFDDKDVK